MFEFLRVTLLSQPPFTASFHKRIFLKFWGSRFSISLHLPPVFTREYFCSLPGYIIVFVSLNLLVSILQIDHSTSSLKRKTRNLKYCERNKQCDKWKFLVLFWSEIEVFSIYCMLNGGHRRGNIFLRKRIVRNTSSKFHGEVIYLELFEDFYWNLLDLTL